MPAVTHRHDVLIFFDVTNGNPNGDPDAGNLPRTEPNSGKGLVSDVCLKRKVRNFVSYARRGGDGKAEPGFGILIQQGNVLNAQISAAVEEANPDMPEKPSQAEKNAAAEAAMKWLCRTFYDVRAFGGVLSTGADVMEGSAYGQVRGPVQFTFGMSLDPIATQEITVTRCAVTKEEDAAKERTMGSKHIVPYGLYAAKAFVSPIFAERTGFDEADLALFFDALRHLFSNDQSAARAEMNVRAVYDFEHVGTQTGRAAGQNRREAMLGCAHAHRLFAQVTFERTVEGGRRTFPASFDDYRPVDLCRGEQAEDGRLNKFPGVKLHRIVDPAD